MEYPFLIPTENPATTVHLMTMDDAPKYFDVIQKNRDHLAKYMSGFVIGYQTLEQVQKTIRDPLSLGSYSEARFCIRNNDKFAGVLLLTPHETDTVEIGYWLDCDHVGFGIATFAVTALSNHALYRRRFVVAKIKPDNLRSAKTLQRSGFHEDESTDPRYRWFEKSEPIIV